MRQRGGLFHLLSVIIILAIVGVGFFCTQNVLASESILISEVQITGGAGKTGNDFIELYNSGSSPVNLKGYRLVKRAKTGATDTNIKSWTADTFIPANGYYLWASSGYTDIAVTPNATTTITISDDNGIAIRFGAVDSGIIIDSLAWGNAQNAFVEGTVFPTNSGANQSLERRANLDTNNNSADFFIQTNPSPQNSGVVVTPPPAEPTPTPTPSPAEAAASTDVVENLPASVEPVAQKINFGEVLINEFVSDPTDNEVEWVELYNKTSREIDLTGWWLEDGSKAKTNLSGSLAASGSGKYKVIEKPAGVLNNDGDLVVLYDATGKIIDQVAYGNWADGNLTDNAPVASDPNSVARKFDGYNTFNNANDFAITIKPTKGTSNLIQVEDEVSAEAKAGFDFASDIFISEILPNPTGDDTKLEFIEIYNAGKREVNLTGWSLSNEDNKKINLEKIATTTIIKAGEYLAVYRPKTKIVLHNDQGEVKLFQPLADKPFLTVGYKNVKEGWSYNLENMNNPPSPLYQGGSASGEWLWSETPTPGAANMIKAVNHAPEVDFSLPNEALIGQPIKFDSSDTNDLDGDSLKYNWDFGDGFKNDLANPEHTFFKSGIYKIKLVVSDGQATSTQEKSLKVANSIGELVNVLDSRLRGNDNTEAVARNDNIIINEVFPDPKGADTGNEWLELKNPSLDKINLINWRIENSNGKYKFKNDLWLDAENFYLLSNADSQLAFKNTDDVVSLYNNLDELVDTVKYTNAVEGEAYARGANGKWFWTTKITPGQENEISLAGSQSAILGDGSGATGSAEDYMETDLEKVREMEIGSLVKVKGTVAVEPGILGTQIFYVVGSPAQASSSVAASPEAEFFTATLADKEVSAGKPGMQIYNYNKDFPILKVGDYIEISGELTQTQDELRIKTKNKADINLVEHKPAPLALAVKVDEINEEDIGRLISITGEITSKKAGTVYLDDGNDEILVYFKQSAGLDTKNLKPGQTVAVTGILSKTSTGLRLLPRYQEDIKPINQAGLTPQVLGESIVADEWVVAERDKKIELFKYLLIIAGGLIVILVGLFIKMKRKKAA